MPGRASAANRAVVRGGLVRSWTGPGLSADMFEDEELARADMVGRAIHDIIGRQLQRTATPSTAEILRDVQRALSAYRPIEARAHRQNIAAGVAAYFRRLLPPAEWRFAGAELWFGTGRLDLVWERADGAILLDEVKTGNPRQLHTTRTRDQVSDYLGCAKSVWPDRVCGLRLLSTSEPHGSLFVSPDGSATALRATTYVRTDS